MNIIVVGAGKIGFTLTQYLTHEGHNVTVIDRDADRIGLVNTTLDAITISGPVDIELLRLAGADKADLLIAATNSDESNILCCMMGRKLGVGHTIARVREKDHYDTVMLLQEELGLSMAINPELITAQEISRVLRFPSAAKVEPFAKGQAELVEFKLAEGNPLCGTALKNYHSRFGRGTLICAVRRGDEVYTPDGEFVIQAGDIVNVVGAPRHIYALFKDLDIFKKSAKSVMIVGGGFIGMYLSRQLLGMGIRVKLVERDPEKCNHLKDRLPKADIVCCDGSRPDLLEEEGLRGADAFVSITGSDEINIILGAYARSVGVGKAVAKVNEQHLISLAESFGLEEPVQPKVITAQQVLRYVRSVVNASDASGVEQLRRIMDGKLEVLEFRAGEASPVIGMPLRRMDLRPGVRVAAVIRDGRCHIPGGDDEIRAGDSVLAVTTQRGMTRLEDIMRG